MQSDADTQAFALLGAGQRAQQAGAQAKQKQA
jgi:hypothetical protein